MTAEYDWLESDEEFEGVGAHRLNPRYDPVDEPVPQSRARLAHLPVPRLVQLPPVGRAGLTLAPYRLDGHDGSHYQFDAGPLDLALLAANTWIIWWKATQSTSYTDPTFLRVWANRHQFKQRLAYHWLSSTTDVRQQADHYLQIVGLMGDGDGGMLDAEEYGITVEMCLAFCEAVEAVTHRPFSVYTGLYVSGGSIWKSDALRMSKYGPRTFHVAAYVTEENLRSRLTAMGGQNYPWQAWQYSSNGPVPGITGRADMNRVDDKGMYNLATSTLVLPIPTPTPIPQLGDDMQVAMFEVESLPGIYMWVPGMPAPIPFTNPTDFGNLSTALGALAPTKISKEMYDRLFIPAAPVGQHAGPLNVSLNLSGSASGTATPV